MDWAGPPGGLEKLFAQYDYITHGAHQDAAKPLPSNAPPDHPPWWLPDDTETAKGPPITQAEHEQGVLKHNLGYEPQKSWRDIDADRMAAAEQRMNEHLKNPNGATFQQDENGLVKAYNDETAPGVYYDPATRTEYIKGSSTARDWFDDVTKIPLWGGHEKRRAISAGRQGKTRFERAGQTRRSCRGS
jgi:hypothetical protein